MEPQANELPAVQDKTHSDSAAYGVIKAYVGSIPEFQYLTALREKGWKNAEGDAYFARQREVADSRGADRDERNSQYFFTTMRTSAKELHEFTGALVVRNPAGPSAKILDMCAAPGGFLLTIMHYNPNATATAFSLPVDLGGHDAGMLMPHSSTVDLRELDISMLVEDMGCSALSDTHPDLDRFLPKQLEDGRKYDLVLCDGQVLRPNVHARAPYRNRERCEALRLSTTQLVLGLEHLVDGGTMIALLHKVELPDTVETLHRFNQFSASVRLFKPPKIHAGGSSFYMIAAGIQVNHPAAVQAVKLWKRTWNIATFGSDEEYKEHITKDEQWAEEILKDFGEILVQKGRPIWRIQAEALARKTWTR